MWAAVSQLEQPWWRRWLAMRGRWLWLPAVAALATIALLLALRPRAGTTPVVPELELAVRAADPLGPPSRSLSASVGDLVDARSRGADAIWIYGEAGKLVARCPGDAACSTTPQGRFLTFRITAAGRHRALAVSGAAGLEPSGDFDRDVLAARARGAHLELRSVLARPAP